MPCIDFWPPPLCAHAHTPMYIPPKPTKKDDWVFGRKLRPEKGALESCPAPCSMWGHNKKTECDDTSILDEIASRMVRGG